MSDEEKDDKPQSIAEMNDEYINLRRIQLVEQYYEEKDARRKLQAQGLSIEEAKNALKDAKTRNKLVNASKAKVQKIAGKVKTLRTIGTGISFLASTFWIWAIPLFGCIIFLLIAFPVAFLANPTRFSGLLDSSCTEQAGNDEEKLAQCARDAIEENNRNSFNNRGML